MIIIIRINKYNNNYLLIYIFYLIIFIEIVKFDNV